MWENRCYPDGIPDELPGRLQESMRAPSWKAIAMCILNNDFYLYELGFAPHVSHWYKTVKKIKEKENDNQIDLF